VLSGANQQSRGSAAAEVFGVASEDRAITRRAGPSLREAPRDVTAKALSRQANNTWPQAVASIASVSPSAGDGTYTVRPGDNLYDIAASQLGNPNLWPEIQAANPQLAAAAGTPIYPGQGLRIPRLRKATDGGAS
jgi:nucleoid-associated protein YgaU